MLCIRHFYNRLFHANKPGSRIFSIWRNFPIIFDNQFMQFQQNRNARFSFKPQQLQRSQFCSGINFGKKDDNHLPRNLDTQFLWLDPYRRKNVQLEICKGKQGHKYIHIFVILYKYKYGKFINIPNILVPEDAYSFVRALDQLIVELASENFEQKMEIKDSQSSIENGHQILKTIELTGIYHKFQLELLFFPNEHQQNGQKSICFQFYGIHKITGKKSCVINLPLEALPWLRKQMAKMLMKFDGTVEIEKEAPAQIPQKFLHTDVSPTLLTVRNGISSAGQKLEHNGNRQQFVNKKPPFFQQYSKMPTRIQNSIGVKNQKMFTPSPFQQKLDFKRPKMINNKNSTDAAQLDPKMTALEQGIRTLFDFDDDEMEKYRRIAAKVKYPSR